MDTLWLMVFTDGMKVSRKGKEIENNRDSSRQRTGEAHRRVHRREESTAQSTAQQSSDPILI